jgi:hypothetical protein
VVLDAPQPAVYCLPGRPATIVLTTGALAVLGPTQLLRRSGRDTLLEALVAMGTGKPLPTPSASLAATGGVVSARVRRLLDPPGRTSRACHGLALSAVLLALAGVSVLLPVLLTLSVPS